jgi:hypothetical protein
MLRQRLTGRPLCARNKNPFNEVLFHRVSDDLDIGKPERPQTARRSSSHADRSSLDKGTSTRDTCELIGPTIRFRQVLTVYDRIPAGSPTQASATMSTIFRCSELLIVKSRAIPSPPTRCKGTLSGGS